MRTRAILRMFLAPTALALPAVGCAESTGTGPDLSDSIPGVSALTGSIHVAAATTGPSPDTEGYSVTVAGVGTEAIGANGTVMFTDLAPGEYEIVLTGSPSDCDVIGEKLRVVQVETGAAASAYFGVRCPPERGEEIAFARLGANGRRAIHIMDAEGGNAVRVSDPPDRSADSDPVWSPDGARIAFTRGDGNRRVNMEVWVMDADGGDPRRITAFDNALQPAWSPDGEKIAFTAQVNDDYEIYVRNVDGTNAVNLTNSPRTRDSEPAWSPDGTRIAFVRCCGEGEASSPAVFVLDVRTGSAVRVTDPGELADFGPAWSPDGTRIVFSREDPWDWWEHAADVWVVDADGENPKSLTNHDADDRDPAWSPDGTRIAFTTNRDGDYDIYVMEADGDNPVRVTEIPGPDTHSSWFATGPH